MKTNRSSTTAEVTALIRALESRLPNGARLFEDPFAREFLGYPFRTLLSLFASPLLYPKVPALLDPVLPGVLASVVGRTHYIDEVLIRAVHAGIQQVVLLGAGFDCRAYRLPELKTVRIFEVDHPDTQKRKRMLLTKVLGELPANVAFVSIDFERDELSRQLMEAGLSNELPTFFVWEGVCEYLTSEAVDTTLRFVATEVPTGSQIAFTYKYLEESDSVSKTNRMLFLQRFVGEPATFTLDPKTVHQFLMERSLKLEEDVSGPELFSRYFEPRGRKLIVNQVDHAVLATSSKSIKKRTEPYD